MLMTNLNLTYPRGRVDALWMHGFNEEHNLTYRTKKLFLHTFVHDLHSHLPYEPVSTVNGFYNSAACGGL